MSARRRELECPVRTLAPSSRIVRRPVFRDMLLRHGQLDEGILKCPLIIRPRLPLLVKRALRLRHRLPRRRQLLLDDAQVLRQSVVIGLQPKSAIDANVQHPTQRTSCFASCDSVDDL